MRCDTATGIAFRWGNYQFDIKLTGGATPGQTVKALWDLAELIAHHTDQRFLGPRKTLLEYEVMEKSGIHPAPQEFTGRQLEADPILRYFYYVHLPQPLQDISSAFCDLAVFIINALPHNTERTVALRKLLEAKDAGVRANVGETFHERQRSGGPDMIGGGSAQGSAGANIHGASIKHKYRFGVMNALHKFGGNENSASDVRKAVDMDRQRRAAEIGCATSDISCSEYYYPASEVPPDTNTFIDAGDGAEVQVTGGGSSEEPIPFD